jgi:hypothetical protein
MERCLGNFLPYRNDLGSLGRRVTVRGGGMSHILSIVSWWDSRTWFSGDGWNETNHQGPYLYHDPTWAYLSTYDTSYNQPFCGGTWIEYHPITLFAHVDGTASGGAYTYDYGCDAGLLSWYAYLW